MADVNTARTRISLGEALGDGLRKLVKCCAAAGARRGCFNDCNQLSLALMKGKGNHTKPRSSRKETSRGNLETSEETSLCFAARVVPAGLAFGQRLGSTSRRRDALRAEDAEAVRTAAMTL